MPFVIFGLTLLGVALFHHRALAVALAGLFAAVLLGVWPSCVMPRCTGHADLADLRELDRVVLARPDRVAEILADLLGVDVERGRELDVADVVAAEVDVHEARDVLRRVGVLVYSTPWTKALAQLPTPMMATRTLSCWRPFPLGACPLLLPFPLVLMCSLSTLAQKRETPLPAALHAGEKLAAHVEDALEDGHGAQCGEHVDRGREHSQVGEQQPDREDRHPDAPVGDADLGVTPSASARAECTNRAAMRARR